MKKFITFLSMLAIVFSLQAQNTKLPHAIFDPSSSGTSIDEGTKMAVRELISSTLVNTGKYTIVERSLLQQVMKEQKFTNTDLVDESQATKLGKLAGANKVVLSVVSLVGGRNMLSIKIIDVQTATIDQQKTKVMQSAELLDIVEPLTKEVIGEPANYPTDQVVITPPDNTPPSKGGVLYRTSPFKGCGCEIQVEDAGNAPWDYAQSLCPAGWRLPTIQEIECMYKNRKLIGWFQKHYYWTSEEIDRRSAYDLDFGSGKLNHHPKKAADIRVRAVR